MEEQIVQETQIAQPVVENQTQTPVVEKQSLIENNLSALRKKLEAEEKARKEAENRAAQLAAQVKAQAEPEDDDVDESTKRVAYLEEKINRMEVETITQKLPNFAEIVTDDNLATLQRLYPEDYEGIRHNPDVKARAKMAYNMINNYGIATAIAKKNNEKIEENKKKPTAASLGAPQAPATPLARLDEYGRRRFKEGEQEEIMKKVALKRRYS